jgi:hypothetical protein
MEITDNLYNGRENYWYTKTYFKILILIICLVPAIIYAFTLK